MSRAFTNEDAGGDQEPRYSPPGVNPIAAPAVVNDEREIFGWKMYDWANSAFSTTVAGALLAPYVTSLAQSVVGRNGVVADLGAFGAVTAESYFPFCISVSVAIQALMLPIVGAIAD